MLVRSGMSGRTAESLDPKEGHDRPGRLDVDVDPSAKVTIPYKAAIGEATRSTS